MTKDPNQSGFSRRGVLKGASALGAAALILPAGMRRASAEPKKGGVLRVGMGHGSTSDSLDPGSWDNAYSQVFAQSRHNYLTEIAADGSLEPEIAESWEASADAKVWTFKIRDGVTFHNGKTVTPEDVVASINYHRGEDSQSAAKPIVDPISDIAIDGQTRCCDAERRQCRLPLHHVGLPHRDHARGGRQASIRPRPKAAAPMSWISASRASRHG